MKWQANKISPKSNEISECNEPLELTIIICTILALKPNLNYMPVQYGIESNIHSKDQMLLCSD